MVERQEEEMRRTSTSKELHESVKEGLSESVKQELLESERNRLWLQTISGLVGWGTSDVVGMKDGAEAAAVSSRVRA